MAPDPNPQNRDSYPNFVTKNQNKIKKKVVLY